METFLDLVSYFPGEEIATALRVGQQTVEMHVRYKKLERKV
jgi:hypothetical protein